MKNGIYIFDSSAVIRYLDDKAGADRVQQFLESHALFGARLLISAVQWGEIARIVGRRHGTQAASQVLSRLTALGFQAIPVTALEAVRAAVLQNAVRLSYADAFVLVLAQDHPLSILITADFDFKLAEHLVSIEFLPSTTP